MIFFRVTSKCCIKTQNGTIFFLLVSIIYLRHVFDVAIMTENKYECKKGNCLKMVKVFGAFHRLNQHRRLPVSCFHEKD